MADVQSDGLIGHWAFDGCDGKIVKDRSGNGNDGVIVSGTLHKEPGAVSLALNEVDDGHVRVELKQSLRLTEAITSVFWFRADRLRSDTVLFGIPNSNPDWTTPVFGMSAKGGHVVYGQFGGKGVAKALVETRSPVPLKQWVCMAATSDGTTVRLYVNGALDAELKQRAALTFNGNPLLIGAGLGRKPTLRGRIGELRLYRRALSPEEIGALFEDRRRAYGWTPPVSPCRLTVRSSSRRTAVIRRHRGRGAHSGRACSKR